MKNTLKSTLYGLTLIALSSCIEDDFRVHFDTSMPVIEIAQVAETAIMYGDSIHLNVSVMDPKTPLSTLEIKVVVGDEIIASEKVRTKGNEASYSQSYWVPLVAHMPDGADVEVHLKSMNIEGTTKDTIIATTIASRPEIPSINLVTTTAAVELQLIDAENLIYTADGLSFGNQISFRLATKLNKFKKIDWSNPDNLVFGLINNQIGLAAVTIDGTLVNVEGDMITLYDPTLVGFRKITLDLYNFTIKGEGDKLTPATNMNINNFTALQMSSVDHMNVVTKETWKSITMYLGTGTEMTFTGITDAQNCLDPTFFEAIDASTAKFLGPTGIYTVYYLPRLDYVFVEQPKAVYPEVLWLVGVGMGPARTPAIKTSSWNWNSPLEYRFCRRVSEGVYEAVFFANHEVDPAADEPWRLTFGVKFMHQRTWGDEESSQYYTMPNSYLYSPSPNDKGNFNATADFANLPGIYRFTIDVNNKTTSFVKIK